VVGTTIHRLIVVLLTVTTTRRATGTTITGFVCSAATYRSDRSQQGQALGAVELPVLYGVPAEPGGDLNGAGESRLLAGA